LSFLKGEGLEIGNWDGMQLLQKNYGLITYLTCIYIYIYIYILFYFIFNSTTYRYIYPRVIGKKIANSKFYNLFIYQFQWWSKAI
jgi:hypothetical protein